MTRSLAPFSTKKQFNTYKTQLNDDAADLSFVVDSVIVQRKEIRDEQREFVSSEIGSMFLLTFVLFLLIAFRVSSIDSTCQLDTQSTTLTCDGSLVSDVLPSLSCFPPVNVYVFRNFARLNAETFENLTLLPDRSLTMQLSNVALIESETFSKRLVLPENSTLSIEIERAGSSAGMTLEENAFNDITIARLSFRGIQLFNGRPVFDTTCFGDDLDIKELILKECAITGFSNGLRKAADVFSLSIVDAPALTQLTEKSLPSFFPTSKSLTISNTALQLINKHTFDAWLLTLEELILTNNSNFTNFPSQIVDGVLMKLNTLDFSDNPIQTVEKNANWFAFSYARHLSLRKQRWDVFLPTDILKQLPFLESLDLSDGVIDQASEELITSYIPPMAHLTSIDLSRSNLTETMLILLLDRLGQSVTQSIDIYLFGQRLDDRQFCSYYRIFQKAADLFTLHLDEGHKCNCIVDLFYTDRVQQLTRPTCLSNASRVSCDIQTQLSVSKCLPDQRTGNGALVGIVAGVSALLVVVLTLGFGFVYRRRRRRETVLDMENPLWTIIEERLQRK